MKPGGLTLLQPLGPDRASSDARTLSKKRKYGQVQKSDESDRGVKKRKFNYYMPNKQESDDVHHTHANAVQQQACIKCKRKKSLTLSPRSNKGPLIKPRSPSPVSSSSSKPLGVVQPSPSRKSVQLLIKRVVSPQKQVPVPQPVRDFKCLSVINEETVQMS